MLDEGNLGVPQSQIQHLSLENIDFVLNLRNDHKKVVKVTKHKEENAGKAVKSNQRSQIEKILVDNGLPSSSGCRKLGCLQVQDELVELISEKTALEVWITDHFIVFCSGSKGKVAFVYYRDK